VRAAPALPKLMIARASIMRLSWTIQRRDGVTRSVAMRKAWAWAKRKAAPGAPPAMTKAAFTCTFPSRACECGARRCLEVKKPFNERDRSICLRPTLCGCDNCGAPAKYAARCYAGASGGW
jgi:hypothetical protein